MSVDILLNNFSNPTFLFFILGILAVLLKSDLALPASSSRFISLYLLFAIGFRGGQELSHSGFSEEILLSLAFGVALSLFIPSYCFFILRIRFSISDSAAIAACYGSVSAVTYVSAIQFLESRQLSAGGHMVAVMALMEAPAIIISLIMLNRMDPGSVQKVSLSSILKHSFTNGSVFLICGSLLIGLIADSKQAEGIRPFTNDIFKGFLALFLLDMGMVAARRFESFRKSSYFALLFGIIIPLFNGCAVAWLSSYITQDLSNRFIFCILAASASYIAVPAAMQLSVPNADPGIYIPMAIGITFPFNISIGMPVYYHLINNWPLQ
ncbi:MAG: sodium-dependent bicarbonate transport family permease [Saprospiraceae bacterium]